MTLKIENKSDLKEIEKTPLSTFLKAACTYDIIANSAKDHPDFTAIRYLPTGDTNETPYSLSYDELLRKLNQTSNLFKRLGIDHDSVVSYLLPNIPQTHLTIWAGETAGIVNPINPMLSPDVISEIMNEAGTKVLVALGPIEDSDIWSKVEDIASKVDSLKFVLKVNLALIHGGDPVSNSECDDSLDGIPVLDFDTAISWEDPCGLNFEKKTSSQSIASYFHTGGTTGKPKIAQHSHLNEVSNASIFSAMISKDSPANFFVGLPLFHVNAVIATGLGVFASGGCITLLTSQGYRSPQIIQNFWGLVAKYKATHFSCVPTVLTSILNTDISDCDISSLDFAICGAAPLSPAVFTAFERKFGVRILEGYGLTEGTCVSALNPPHGERRNGSIGLPFPYQEMKPVIIDSQGEYIRDCEIGEVGVIAICGPNVFPGYKQQSMNKGLFVKDCWLNTGDLGREDEDGYFWLTGRAKDLIIRGGHNIDPGMIEDCLSQHPAVAEAAAIGQPDAYAGEMPCAYVTLKPGQRVTSEELIYYARTHLSERAATPSYIGILSEMPLTGVGKIFKPALRVAATERVISEHLASAQLDSSIDVKQEDKLGLVAYIRSQHPREAIEHELSRFAISYQVVDNQ